MTPSRWLWAVALLAGMVLGTLPLIPPARASGDAPQDRFSAERAMSHVEMIAREPHPLGSDEIVEVREYIVRQMTNLGLEVEQQIFTAPDYFGTPGNTVEGANVLARLAGTDPTGTLLFVAHYDTVPTTPGANDNSAAVSALIESARALTAGAPLENDIVFLFTDGEEPSPRFGVKAFTGEHPWFDDVALVVNLEAAGGGGVSQLAEVNGDEESIVGAFVAASPSPVVFSYATEITSMIGEVGTDFDEFRRRGVPGLAFAYIHGSTIYHTERDSIEAVGEASLQHHGEHVLAIARLGSIEGADDTGSGGSTYFTLGPKITIQYPDAWGVALGLLALALLGRAIVSSRGIAQAVKGLSLTVLVFVGTLIAGAVAWGVIGSARPAMSTFEGYVYFGLLTLLVTWAVVALLERSGTSVLAGVVTFWGLLGLTSALLAPGLGYLLIWPAMVGSVLLLARRSTVARIGVILVIMTLHIPWIDFLLQMSMPRPGNPDSQLLPLGGAAVAFAVLSLLVVRETAYDRTA